MTNAYLHRTFSNRRGYLRRNETDKDGAGPSGTCHGDDKNINSAGSDTGDSLGDDDNLGKEIDEEDFMGESDDDNI